jgi:NTE family protein
LHLSGLTENAMMFVNPPHSPPLAPPRLALVLGSGGVRSAAALGVAQVLNEAGIGIDVIAGCSSGALFGAVLASGWSHEVALRACTTLWSQEVTEQRRWKAYLQLLMPRLAGFGESFSLRSDRLIEARLRAAFGEHRIESLALPLRIATTDAATGQRHVISHGPLVPALRASMALPFVFPSVPLQGRRLVDGVLSDPLPVSAVPEARLVLTLGFDGRMPRRVNRPGRLVAQASTALINNLQHARLEAAQAQGQQLLQLQLRLERNVGLWQTAAIPAICAAGHDAAREALPEIRERLQRSAEHFSGLKRTLSSGRMPQGARAASPPPSLSPTSATPHCAIAKQLSIQKELQR